MTAFAEKLLLNILGYSMLFICAAMCYMPVAGKLKVGARKLTVITAVSLSCFVLAGALISTCFDMMQNTVMLPASVLFFLVYYKTLDADVPTCLYLFMYVMSLSCYPYHYALIIDAITNPGGSYELFPAWVGLLQICFLLVTAVVFFFKRKSIFEFVENLKKVSMRKIFWIVPCFYTVVLILFIPLDYKTIYTKRIIYLYPTVIVLLFTTEIIIIYLFTRIMREITNNEKLERENQTLEFQSKRYESLKSHIEQTARIRHDFRQHLHTISSFAESGKYDDLKKYLADYSESIADTKWSAICQNNAVDAIASYYSTVAGQRGIITDWRLDLPKVLPLAESIFCGMLGNLIENSIYGCETCKDREKTIHLSARMPSSSMLAVVIENSFDGKINVDKKGEILSSRHKGHGIGLRSIHAVAEKYNGHMQIDYDDKMFRVSVLLNF